MMTVGLTGGIGSGKTTVARLFTALNIPVYDSDTRAKKLMEAPGKLRTAITELLGEAAFTGKKLNRPYIAGKVFDDKDLLKQLNNLVHPAVKRDFRRWAALQDAPYVIQEAAILFENGTYKEHDKIILVTAPEEVRVARIMERDGSSEKEVRSRMEHQWKDSRKEALAHFTIVNTDLECTRASVAGIHAKLLQTTV